MNKPAGYDFAGWVTKNDILCLDGTTIKQDAFSGNSGAKVPLIWQHNYTSPSNVIGNIILHNMDGGVYGYGFLNKTETANDARESIRHGDINAMSIGARGIKKSGNNIIHGLIYEVSLVLSGANPGATIEYNTLHSAYSSGEDPERAIITNGMLIHSIDSEPIIEEKEETQLAIIKHADNEVPEVDTQTEAAKEVKQVDDKSDTDVLDTLTPEQYDAVVDLVAGIMEDLANKAPEGEEATDAKPADVVQQSILGDEETILKHNAFTGTTPEQVAATPNIGAVNTLLHSAINGQASSLNRLFIENGLGAEDIANGLTLKHGLTNIEVLFPETTLVNGMQIVDPGALNVDKIMASFAKSPMSRVKNIFANLTEETARARGYIKGTEKIDSIEEVFFRETTPGTVIRRTKFDRDDMIDIEEAGINILDYIQKVQQSKLQQEIVRAAFFGDGRPATVLVSGQNVKNPDRIDPKHIRPIVTDDKLFTITKTAADWKTFGDTLVMAMPFYQGSGSPTLYMNPLDIAKLRTTKDANERYMYGPYDGRLPGLDMIAAALGVKEILEYREVPVGQAVVINLADYQFGASKGGQIANFDFFDIDFNQQKYLIETRLSGALQTPKSAIVINVTDKGVTDLSDLKFDGTGLSKDSTWTTDSAKEIKPAGKPAVGSGV